MRHAPCVAPESPWRPRHGAFLNKPRRRWKGCNANRLADSFGNRQIKRGAIVGPRPPEAFEMKTLSAPPGRRMLVAKRSHQFETFAENCGQAVGVMTHHGKTAAPFRRRRYRRSRPQCRSRTPDRFDRKDSAMPRTSRPQVAFRLVDHFPMRQMSRRLHGRLRHERPSYRFGQALFVDAAPDRFGRADH